MGGFEVRVNYVRRVKLSNLFEVKTLATRLASAYQQENVTSKAQQPQQATSFKKYLS